MMKGRILLVSALALSVCILASCGKEESFINPGDYLGGGGTGEIAGSADDVTGDVKNDFSDEDFSELSGNTSSAGAVTVAPTDGVYTISDSGTYFFKGKYGGLALGADGLKLHLVFDGAAIETAEGIALDGSDHKKAEVVITLLGENSIVSTAEGENAVHIKGTLSFNGEGSLSVESGKNAIKVSKELAIVDCALTLTAANHAISALSVSASDCQINVLSAGKDGINAECDDETTAFTTDEGYVYLKNVDYSCETAGDGIQADTVVYLDGGNYNIKTTGTFVPKTQMSEYGIDADDFKFIKSGNTYQRIASDETSRYGASQLYGLVQGCKGIKVGEIEYPDESAPDKEITVTEGDYSIIIESGTFIIDSTDDAVHANSGNLSVSGGSFTISTYDDALTSDNLTKITGGEITVTKSYEGIEGGYVEILGGTVNVTASDDGINAASDDTRVIEHILIGGGEIYVNAEGDGVDSNGSINMTGGTLIVFGPTSMGNGSLDADRGIVIDGGYLFAVGPLGMVETPASNSKQNVLSYAQNQAISANTVLSLADENGTPIFSVTIEKNCQSVIVSCPELVMGGSFKLYGGDTQLCAFTVSAVITSIGSQGNMGNPGGTPPGGFGGGFGGGRGPGGR